MMNTQPKVKREGTSGSHRSDPSWIFSPPIILTAILATLILLAGAVFLYVTHNDDNKTAAGEPSKPSPTLTSSGPTTSPSPTDASPSDPSSEVTTPADLPRVLASSPRKLILAGTEIGFDESLTNQVDHLIPRTTAELSRWDARGRPESPSSSSVVIIGKTKTGGAFEELGSVVAGDEITIRTDTGEFTYTVTDVGQILVKDQVDNPALADAPGRLLLIGSQYDAAGDRTTEDILVTAQLTDVVPS
jgi:hypothetical protein